MLVTEVESLARKGSPEDLVGLLKAFGDSKDDGYGELGLDIIAKAVGKDHRPGSKKKKRAVIADFVAGQGAFAKPG